MGPTKKVTVPSSKKKTVEKVFRFETIAEGHTLAITRSGTTYFQSDKLINARVEAKRRNPNSAVFSPELAPEQIESEHGETDWPSRDPQYFYNNADTANARDEVQRENLGSDAERQRQEAIQRQRQEETDRYCQGGPGKCIISGGRSKKSRRRNKKTRRHRKK